MLELADTHSMVVGNALFTTEPSRVITYRSGDNMSMIDFRNVTKFAFVFDNVRTSTIFSTFEFVECFGPLFVECECHEIARKSYRIRRF